MSLQKESVSEKLVKRDSDNLRKNGEQLKALNLQNKNEWEEQLKRLQMALYVSVPSDVAEDACKRINAIIEGSVSQREKEIAEEVEKYVLHFQALRDEQLERENVMLAYDFDSRIVAAKQILKKILKYK